MTAPTPPPSPGQAAQVFAAEDLYVSHGVNQGDALEGPEMVVLGDLYELDAEASPRRLSVSAPQDGPQSVGPASQIGRPGDPVQLMARYTLMAPDGDRVEVLLLRLGAEQVALPLSPMAARIGYALVDVDAAPGGLQLADHLCLSFARGTMITLGDGTQRAIEALRPGDRILTRDHGRQPIRWIGQTRQRAAGDFAPVVIAAGTLGNEGDLILGQHHRVFLYHREKLPGVTTSELLVQARHLVDGDRVFIREGGWTDYFSLVFDGHEIVYAEGVPSESLLVTEAVVNRLPAEVAEEVKTRFPGLSQAPHFGTETGRQALEGIATDRLFRKPGR
jgi:Hint domain